MSLSISRRTASGLTLGAAASLALPRRAFSQSGSLVVTSGANFKPIPVAVTQFAGDAGPNISSIVGNDLGRSVFLQPIDPGHFPEQISNPDQPPQFAAWKATDAQFIVTGRCSSGGDGRLQTAFRLWDVNAGTQVAGQEYTTDANNSRRVAHIIADAVFSHATGEKGMFDFACRICR